MAGMRTAMAAAEHALAAAGVPSPGYDATELAAYSLSVDRAQLWRHPEPGPDFAAYVARRAAREPLQHITGRAYFRHVVLAVGPGVFVPRPETEVVAGAAIEEVRRLTDRHPDAGAPVVVDLGTGSGAIALAIRAETPGARVHAVEADRDAHSWAQRNLAGSGVDLRLGRLEDSFPELDGGVDVVVSNPPYIPEGAQIRDPEVAEHDPAQALWSGPDGLDAIRAVQRRARRLLRPGGLVVVEHADLQGESAPAVFASAGCWAQLRDWPDLAGRSRYLTARWVPGQRRDCG